MKKPNWKVLIASLPDGLSAVRAAHQLRQPYQRTRKAGRKFGYKFSDGRRFRWGENVAPPNRYVLDPRKVDWSLSNVEIARRLLISRERVRVVRKRLGMPFVEARGRNRCK